MVISSTVTPPSAMAAANAIALSTDSARRTGTSPISRNAFNTATFSIMSPKSSVNLLGCWLVCLRLPLYAGPAALHDPLDLVEGRHGGVTWGGHGESTMCATAVHGPLCALVVEEAVDEA